jgi:hypothetical protein
MKQKSFIFQHSARGLRGHRRAGQRSGFSVLGSAGDVTHVLQAGLHILALGRSDLRPHHRILDQTRLGHRRR